MDNQIGQLISRCFLGGYPLGKRAEPVAQNPGQLQVAAWSQAGGRNTLIVAATFGQPGTAGTILPNALQAGHNLVLALDRALGSGGGDDAVRGP